jgi:hypothetical protein
LPNAFLGVPGVNFTIPNGLIAIPEARTGNAHLSVQPVNFTIQPKLRTPLCCGWSIRIGKPDSFVQSVNFTIAAALVSAQHARLSNPHLRVPSVNFTIQQGLLTPPLCGSRSRSGKTNSGVHGVNFTIPISLPPPT